MGWHFSLAMENLCRPALSYEDFPHRPAVSYADYQPDHERLKRMDDVKEHTAGGGGRKF